MTSHDFASKRCHIYLVLQKPAAKVRQKMHIRKKTSDFFLK